MAARKFTIDHEYLKQLAKRLGRPFSTLYVLSSSNDPFIADTPNRQAVAEWLADIWDRLAVASGAHVRRVFYRMVSQKPLFQMPNGKPFLNTDDCWNYLCNAARDARYLDLIDDELSDRRSAEPVLNLDDKPASEGSFNVETGNLFASISLDLPALALARPHVPQPYHVEIWCEKSTMNDILMPLGVRYGINIVTGVGELSLTRCIELVARARASGRPVRILYVSDFDPGGMSMPVAVARKIEFYVRSHDETLDIQVRPVVLTEEQCIEYRLPRIPIKASEHRGAKFEERFGEGMTELDALEALHPGELQRILVTEIERYYDDELDDEIANEVEKLEDEIRQTTARVHRSHAKDIAALKAEQKKVAAVIDAAKKKMAPILRKIERDLDAADISIPDWPQPREGDEDDDPLFNSTRDYVEQVDRYKEHQGTPTGHKTTTKVCEICGKSYTTMRSNSRACSKECRTRLRYLPGGERNPNGAPEQVKNPKPVRLAKRK